MIDGQRAILTQIGLIPVYKGEWNCQLNKYSPKKLVEECFSTERRKTKEIITADKKKLGKYLSEPVRT